MKDSFEMNGAHSSATPELEEFAASFALEALDFDERDAYARHLSRCPLCQQLVGDFQTTADLLPETLELVEASPGLKQGILSQARSEIQRESYRAIQRMVEPERSERGWRWPNWFAPLSLGFAAALVIVVGALAFWNIRLHQNTNNLLAQNSSLQETVTELNRDSTNLTELVSMVVSGASVSTIPGTEQSPNAIGALIRSIRSQQAVLLIDNLPALPESQQYQVWRIAEGVPISAGDFFVQDSQGIVVPLDVCFSDADLLGVSIEPTGGSESPTGDIVLLGPLQ